MPERTEYAPGTFSWVDLMTTDVEATQAFYGGLFGWEYQIAGDPENPYIMAHKDEKPVAGMGRLSDEQLAMGVPPNWSSYVTVESADETAAKAAELGGTVLMGPIDAMGTGRMAFVAAPGGEALGIWEPRTHVGAGLVNEHGTLGWNELATRDLDGAISFYTGLFGWSTETGPSPSGQGDYTSIQVGDKMNGGMLVMDANWPAEVPAYWGVYFYVDDLDAAVASTKELGGNVVMPGMNIPEVGKIAVIQDPTGASLTLMEPVNTDLIE